MSLTMTRLTATLAGSNVNSWFFLHMRTWVLDNAELDEPDPKGVDRHPGWLVRVEVTQLIPIKNISPCAGRLALAINKSTKKVLLHVVYVTPTHQWRAIECGRNIEEEKTRGGHPLFFFSPLSAIPLLKNLSPLSAIPLVFQKFPVRYRYEHEHLKIIQGGSDKSRIFKRFSKNNTTQLKIIRFY